MMSNRLEAVPGCWRIKQADRLFASVMAQAVERGAALRAVASVDEANRVLTERALGRASRFLQILRG